jgi:hypothetical protein
MNLYRITEASEAIEWLAEQAATPGEESHERTSMALVLTLARSYLIEYAAHIANGHEPYDALMATVKGELQLSQSQSDDQLALTPPGSAK